jgi:hypothetical protein
MSDGSPNPYDHFRAGTGAPVPEGVYRVVGHDGESVTLLRLTNASGGRTNTGEVERVEVGALADAFEPAENPDSGFSPFDLLDPFSAMFSALRYRLGF